MRPHSSRSFARIARSGGPHGRIEQLLQVDAFCRVYFGDLVTAGTLLWLSNCAMLDSG
jgi:hypothetical protein